MFFSFSLNPKKGGDSDSTAGMLKTVSWAIHSPVEPLKSLKMGGYNLPGLLEITLWLFNIAMGNDPFIDGLPGLPIKKMVIFHGYVSHNQMAYWS